VRADDWLANCDLDTLALRREGVIVLGVQRPDGAYVGVPKGDTVIRPEDVLILYSRRGKVAELDRRRRGRTGDREHRTQVREQDRRRTMERERDTTATAPTVPHPERLRGRPRGGR
jgi:uncharacterized protein with PhoU and TrkA domain